MTLQVGEQVPTLERALQPVKEEAAPKPEVVFVQLQKLGPKDTFVSIRV